MKINPVDRQLDLISIPPVLWSDSNATSRVAYGLAAEWIVMERLKLERVKKDGRFNIVFDAYKNGTYYEIKSCHANKGKVVIYKFRLQKELDSGQRVIYAILTHKMRGFTSDAVRDLNKHIVKIIQVPLERIAKLCEGLTLNLHKPKFDNPRYGYSRGGYIEGYYNLPITNLTNSET